MFSLVWLKNAYVRSRIVFLYKVTSSTTGRACLIQHFQPLLSSLRESFKKCNGKMFPFFSTYLSCKHPKTGQVKKTADLALVLHTGWIEHWISPCIFSSAPCRRNCSLCSHCTLTDGTLGLEYAPSAHSLTTFLSLSRTDPSQTHTYSEGGRKDEG